LRAAVGRLPTIRPVMPDTRSLATRYVSRKTDPRSDHDTHT